jgi:RimJ/RimL family protein N-acetyltransferase
MPDLDNAPRVRLRRATIADVPLIERWRSEPSAALHQPLRRLTRQELERILAKRARVPLAPVAKGKLQWIVEVAGEPVGGISLDIKIREHGVGAIGYMIAERHRGQGFAAEAIRVLAAMAFDPGCLGLERLEAVAAVENVASRRTLERAGFRFEGVRRGYLNIGGARVDHAAYGLLRSDWIEEAP